MGPRSLLRNDNGNQNDMLRVKLIGTRSNRDGIGAKVTVVISNGEHLAQMVKGGSSYLSQSELPLTFGLGKPGANWIRESANRVAERKERILQRRQTRPDRSLLKKARALCQRSRFCSRVVLQLGRDPVE